MAASSPPVPARSRSPGRLPRGCAAALRPAPYPARNGLECTYRHPFPVSLTAPARLVNIPRLDGGRDRSPGETVGNTAVTRRNIRGTPALYPGVVADIFDGYRLAQARGEEVPGPGKPR